MHIQQQQKVGKKRKHNAPPPKCRHSTSGFGFSLLLSFAPSLYLVDKEEKAEARRKPVFRSWYSSFLFSSSFILWIAFLLVFVWYRSGWSHVGSEYSRFHDRKGRRVKGWETSIEARQKKRTQGSSWGYCLLVTSLAERVAQPFQTLVQTVTGSGAGGLDVLEMQVREEGVE